MDDSVLPAVGSFEVVLDGVPETPTVAAWTTNTKLALTIAGSGSTSAYVNLLTVDMNLRNAGLIVATAPQSRRVL